MHNKIKIYAIYIDDVSDLSAYEPYYSFIDDFFLKKILEYKKTKDIELSILTYLLSKYMIYEKSGIAFEDICFERSKYGKPYIKKQGIYFNVSHSHKMIIGACDDSEIGIDIEEKKRVNLRVAEKCFTNNEYEYILKGNNQLEKFYEIWTQKESFIKAVGKGMKIPLSSFDTRKKYIKYQNEKFFFRSFYLKEDYTAAICLRKKVVGYEIVSLDVKELLMKFSSLTI